MKRNGARSRERARIAAAFGDSTHKRARLATKRTAFDASPLAKRTVFAVVLTALLRFARGFASLFGGGRQCEDLAISTGVAFVNVARVMRELRASDLDKLRELFPVVDLEVTENAP